MIQDMQGRFELNLPLQERCDSQVLWSDCTATTMSSRALACKD